MRLFNSFLFTIFSLTLLSQGYEKEVLITFEKDTLFGIIDAPSENIDYSKPILLIIPGSGPTDRNGNNMMMMNNSLLKLSNGLNQMGYVTLRYDKRGVGQSTNAFIDEVNLDFEINIQDAQRFIDYLQLNGFENIAVLGHSEGSLIGMILAQRNNLKKFISVAGAGSSIDAVLKEQYKSTAPVVRDSAYVVIDNLKNGITMDTLSPWLMSVFRPSIQNYMMSWMAYDPALELQFFKGKKIIIQGSTDIQTSIKDAERLKKYNDDAELVIIDNMNHIFKESSSDRTENRKTYNNPNLPIHSDLVFEIVKFLKSK